MANQDTSGKELWAQVRSHRQGFQPRRDRLLYRGVLHASDDRNKVMAAHLSEVQWAPTSITEADKLFHSTTPPTYHTARVPSTPFGIWELEEVLHDVKKGKAPGLDDITPDEVKLLDDHSRTHLLHLFNSCLSKKRIPSAWKKARVASLYKQKGSDSEPCNYRPISLLSTLYKVYTRLLHKRISSTMDDRLRQTQNGFRAAHSSRIPLHVTRRLQELYEKDSTPLYMLFLDWSMAFDRIDHTALLGSLRRLGMPQHYLDVIKDIYTDPTFQVTNDTAPPGEGICQSGIRQGCPLSPYLFVMVMTVLMSDVDDKLVSQGISNTTWSYRHKSYDMEYADDTLLYANSISQMQGLFTTVETVAARYGLCLNQNKTVLLRLFSTSTPPIIKVKFLNGHTVPEASSSIYLGVTVTNDARQGKALSVRLGKAAKEFDKLKTVWNSPLAHRLKLQIFNTIFQPMILYAASEMSYTASQIKRLDAWYMRHLRRVLKIKASYWSRISHHTALQRAGNPVLPSRKLQSLQLAHITQLFQLPTTHPAFHVCLTSAYTDKVTVGKRQRGHPRQYQLRKNIKTASAWLEESGFPSSEISGKPTHNTAKKNIISISYGYLDFLTLILACRSM